MLDTVPEMVGSNVGTEDIKSYASGSGWEIWSVNVVKVEKFCVQIAPH